MSARLLPCAGVAISFLLAMSCGALAHDTFLLPEAFEISPADSAKLALSSAASFPRLEYGPRPDRVAAMSDRLMLGTHEESALRFTYQPHGEGVKVIGVARGPRDIDLQLAEVEHYFEEIGVSQEVRDRYYAEVSPHTFQETYTKYARTILCVAPCRRLDTEAGRLLGHALEFAAFVDRGGVSMRRFRLFAHGSPVADHQVAVITADGRRRVLRTSAAGVVDLPDDVRGPTLLSAVILRPPAARGERFTSDFATLTFSAP